jgi:hypothetical protein
MLNNPLIVLIRRAATVAICWGAVHEDVVAHGGRRHSAPPP